jgi:DNA polymerase
MVIKPSTCKGCPLETLGSGFALTDGKGEQEVLVVAEALGQDEARAGRPLVGQAGKTWDRIVSRTHDPFLGRTLQRDDFLHANVLNCQPPGNILVKAPYEFGAISHCRPHLEKTLRDFKPKAIVTLGNTPLRWFTGQWGVESLRGYIFETEWGPVVPTYHPSYIQRGNFHLARVVQLDLLKALTVARKGVKHFVLPKAYDINPMAGDFQDFITRYKAAGCPPLAFDIETPYGSASKDEDMTFEQDESYTILMVSFAFEPFKAVSVPWIEPYISMTKELLALPGTKLSWNGISFDIPRLQANGVTFGGELVDVMLAWHWLEPSLPMGLKWVAPFYCPDMPPWKLQMHQNFSWYNAADSDVLLRVFLGVRKELEEQGRWKVFERHFVEFGKTLQRMTTRGVTVDHVARKAAREHFEARFSETVAQAQALAPKEVCPSDPPRGYKKTEEQLKETGLWQEGSMRRILVELSPKDLEVRERVEERAKRRAEKKAELEKKRAEKAAEREAKRAAKALLKATRKPRSTTKRRTKEVAS